jgi:hypothetical protein
VGYILYYLYPAEEIMAPDEFSLIAAEPEKLLFVYAKQ